MINLLRWFMSGVMPEIQMILFVFRLFSVLVSPSGITSKGSCNMERNDLLQSWDLHFSKGYSHALWTNLPWSRNYMLACLLKINILAKCLCSCSPCICWQPPLGMSIIYFSLQTYRRFFFQGVSQNKISLWGDLWHILLLFLKAWQCIKQHRNNLENYFMFTIFYDVLSNIWTTIVNLSSKLPTKLLIKNYHVTADPATSNQLEI